VFPHYFLWIKAADVTQVVGQILNLPVVQRSLVGFRMSEEFPHNLLMFCRLLVSWSVEQEIMSSQQISGQLLTQLTSDVPTWFCN
jgi:hypothetical protein